MTTPTEQIRAALEVISTDGVYGPEHCHADVGAIASEALTLLDGHVLVPMESLKKDWEFADTLFLHGMDFSEWSKHRRAMIAPYVPEGE